MTNSQAAPPLDAPASSGPSGDVRAAFGRELKALKEAAGWTTEEAAERAGITRKTWGRIEAGAPVRGHSIRGVERAFDVPPGSFAKAYDGETSLSEAYQQVTGNPVVPKSVPKTRRRSSDPDGRDDSWAELELRQLLDRFRKVVPHIPTSDLLQVSEAVSTTISIRLQQAIQRSSILEREYNAATRERNESYANLARLEAAVETLRARIEAGPDSEDELQELHRRMEYVRANLLHAIEQTSQLTAHADKIRYEMVQTEQETVYLHKALRNPIEKDQLKQEG
ncbi:helix-turn-helix domain-containing protein [Lentzea chajnantorensis]